MEAIGKNIINVQEIEPRFRHQTIFETYEGLAEGESLTIHNNHDPVPVYYQMLDLFGETFTWEYEQRGPEWWDVVVTKVDFTSQGIKQTTDGELVVDVPSISNHTLKHQTIFQVFEGLKPGKSFIIHNDHDPKPVFYQLQSMHGDVFTWEYLEQGPQWWDIRVTMKEEESKETIGEIVAKNFHAAEIFKRYGIDFCCQGNRTVKQAATEKGIDPVQLEEELRKPTSGSAGGAIHNFDEWDLGFLADYVVNTHHKYVKKTLPELNMYSDKVAKVHGGRHPELHTINELVQQITREFVSHMKDEEEILFPMVKEIENAKENGTSFRPEKSFEKVVDQAEAEHKDVGYALEEIRRLSAEYTLPEDACASYTLLFKMLEELEGDTFTHIHLENNLMFPKAIELEKNLV